MKLTRTLHISSKEFYDYLEKELKNDALKNGKKKLHTIEKGTHFSKNGDNHYARIEFKVLEYQRGICYALAMKSYTDTVIISYKTKEVSEGLEVEFEQIIDSEKNKKHNIIAEKFYETIYLSRMSRTIYDIETAIIKERQA